MQTKGMWETSATGPGYRRGQKSEGGDRKCRFCYGKCRSCLPANRRRRAISRAFPGCYARDFGGFDRNRNCCIAKPARQGAKQKNVLGSGT